MAAEPVQLFDAALHKYGDTVHLHIGSVQPTILTRDPGLVQHVLQKNHRNYQKSRFTRDFSCYIGLGLFTNEGEDWLRQQRNLEHRGATV